jgi:hypothetical protein
MSKIFSTTTVLNSLVFLIAVTISACSPGPKNPELLKPCELPCYLGIQAGITHWKDLEKALDEQNIEYSEPRPSHLLADSTYDIRFDDGYTETSVWVKDDLIIGLQGSGKKDSSVIENDTYSKNLKEVVTALGVPDEIYIHSYNRKIHGTLEVGYFLYYSKKGALLFDSNFADIENSDNPYPITSCPNVFNGGVLYLYSPGMSLDEINKLIRFDDYELKPLGEVSDIDIREFTNRILNNTKEFCFSVSRDWSKP